MNRPCVPSGGPPAPHTSTPTTPPSPEHHHPAASHCLHCTHTRGARTPSQGTLCYRGDTLYKGHNRVGLGTTDMLAAGIPAQMLETPQLWVPPQPMSRRCLALGVSVRCRHPPRPHTGTHVPWMFMLTASWSPVSCCHVPHGQCCVTHLPQSPSHRDTTTHLYASPLRATSRRAPPAQMRHRVPAATSYPSQRKPS